MSSRQLRAGIRYGRWILANEIGQGGNGVVWEANGDEGHGVALKFLKSFNLEPTKDPEDQIRRERRQQRFKDEIQFMQSHLGTPGILPILDFHLPHIFSPDDRPWFATPLAVPLSRAVDEKAHHLQDVVRIFVTIARTLAKFHEKSIFHRDIKPDNILLLEEEPLLGDFGLVDFPGKPAITEAREILGPLFYVAPEMMSNAADIDPAPADVYSLAKTLWVTATGQSYPLPGEQRSSVPALTLSAYVSDSRAKLLDSLLDDATRHEPDHRPTMSRFSDELEGWLASLSTASDTRSIDEQIREIASGFRTLQMQIQDKIDKENLYINAAKATLDQVITQLTTLIPILEQLQIKGFSDDRITPKLVVGDHTPSYWHTSEWTKAAFPLTGKPVWVGSVVIHQQVCGLRGRSCAYHGGLRFALYEQGHLRITAAHALGSLNADMREYHDVPWFREAEVTVGYPLAAAEAMNLTDEFSERFPDAIKALFHLLDDIGSKPPP